MLAVLQYTLARNGQLEALLFKTLQKIEAKHIFPAYLLYSIATSPSTNNTGLKFCRNLGK